MGMMLRTISIKTWQHEAPFWRSFRPFNMKRICMRCNRDAAFEVPLFTNEEKQELQTLANGSPIKTVGELIARFGLPHATAKFIVAHLTLRYGQCNRCDVSNLEEEYATCPKCQALNFNWQV
jgi:hypothetical protein